MIRSFRHKGLEAFFRSGSTRGIASAHAAKLAMQLSRLDASAGPVDMQAPGWRLHPLGGLLAGHWSVRVNGNWRLVFSFRDGHAIEVDYCDYH